MTVLIPKKGDGLQVLAFKLANNSTYYTTTPMIPKSGMHLHDLMLIAAYNLATGGGGGGGGSSANVVTAPSGINDFSTLPGGVAPTSGVYFAPRDQITLWTIEGGDTQWTVIDKNSP